MSTAETEATLTARARRLARPVEQKTAPTGDLTVVPFRSGSEQLAVEAAVVREIVSGTPIVALPGTAPAVAGLTAYRGEVLAVLESGVITGARPASGDRASFLLVLGEGRAELALTADAVEPIRALDSSELTPARAASRSVRGVAPDGTTLIDARAILADESIIVPGDTAE